MTTSPTPRTAPTLGDALRGTVPTLVVHRGWNYADALPGLLDDLHATVGTNAALGAAIRIPRAKPAKNRHFLDTSVSAVLKVADPEIHTLNGPYRAPEADLPNVAQEHPYAQVDMPDDPEDGWIESVLDGQREAGGNVYLSASGWVDSDTGADRLDKQLEFVTATRALLGADETMFVNLTLDGAWLRNPALRDELLQAMVESNEDHWWVRVRWPNLRPSDYVQLTDVDILTGYAELAETAASENKTLILPNSNLTGWVATALGASGFSTGTSAGEQSYAASRGFGTQPGTTRTVTERIFDKNVLHTLVRADQQAVAAAGLTGYLACPCAHCVRISRNGWDRKTAGLHYLNKVAELTADLGRAGRQANAQTIVQNARNLVAALPAAATLTGQSSPTHLDRWADLLA